MQSIITRLTYIFYQQGQTETYYRLDSGFSCNCRVMRVSVSVIRSSCMDVGSGVPQGSVLFLLYILMLFHLHTYVVSKCKLFAYDLKIYLKIRHSNIVDMSSDLSSCQRDIDTMVNVSSSWR